MAYHAQQYATGNSLTESQPSFRVIGYEPIAHLPPLGRLQGVIYAEGEPGDFHAGSSGAVWTINGIPAAIQVGAYEPEYRIGVAQSLHVLAFDWAVEKLQAEQLAIRHVI
ncbi:MAG: hypothetical protein R3E01_14155 [Pirellulaceae bacterium]